MIEIIHGVRRYMCACACCDSLRPQRREECLLSEHRETLERICFSYRTPAIVSIAQRYETNRETLEKLYLFLYQKLIFIATRKTVVIWRLRDKKITHFEILKESYIFCKSSVNQFPVFGKNWYLYLEQELSFINIRSNEKIIIVW